MDLKEIKSLIALLEETGLTEIEVEEGGRKIRVRKEQGQMVTLATPPTATASALQGDPLASQLLQPSQTVPTETGRHFSVINSPIVGTFYRSHQQGAEPYVKVGDVVKKGQILCIVEAMKLMNEIESDHDGVIASVCVEDKSPVEFGQALFKVNV